MTLQEISWVASALSLIVATLALIAGVRDRIKRANADDLLKWQRTIVYSIIRDGVTQFDEIKLLYLAAAQQIEGIQIPKSEIQDGALNLVLLSLQEASLISITADATYLLNVAEPPNEFKKQMESVAVDMFNKQIAEKKIHSRIYEVLEAQQGIFTIDSLHRFFADKGFVLDYDMFNLLVRNLLARREIFSDERQKLHSRPPSIPMPPGQERLVRSSAPPDAAIQELQQQPPATRGETPELEKKKGSEKKKSPP